MSKKIVYLNIVVFFVALLGCNNTSCMPFSKTGEPESEPSPNKEKNETNVSRKKENETNVNPTKKNVVAPEKSEKIVSDVPEPKKTSRETPNKEKKPLILNNNGRIIAKKIIINTPNGIVKNKGGQIVGTDGVKIIAKSVEGTKGIISEKGKVEIQQTARLSIYEDRLVEENLKSGLIGLESDSE